MKKNLSTDRVLIIAAMGLLVAIAALIMVSIFQSKELQQNNELIFTTQEVLLSSEKLLTETINNETSSRGYILTGQASFLDPYKNSSIQIKEHLEFLRSRFIDNPVQNQQLDSLIYYLHKRLPFSKQTIDLYDKYGAAAALKLVQTGEGKNYTDLVRAIIDKIQASENNLLMTRRAALDNKTILFARILLFIVSGMLLVLFLFLLKVRYDFTNDKKNATALQRLNNTLEERVKERTNALFQSQQELTQMLSRITDGFSSLNKNWEYIYLNDKAGSLLNRDTKELIGKSIWDIYPDAVGKDFYNACHKAMQTQQYTYQEEYYPPLDEWFENHIYPSQDGVSIFFRNISERKKVQLQLAESEEKYRIIIETAQEGVWMIDSNNNTIFTNQHMAQMLGYSKEEMLQLPLFHFMDEEGKKIAELNIARRKQGIIEQHEFKFIKKSGEPVWTLLETSPILKNGKYEGAVAMVMNITERKKAEQELINSEKKYKHLFESNPMPMWVLGLDSFDFLAVNEAALKHYGYTKEEFLSLGAKGIRPPEDIQRFVELNRSNFTALHNTGVWRHKKKDGSIIDVEIFAYNIQYEGKKATLVLANDVTERLHSEKLLKQSFEDIRRLASHLQHIREEERKRIGREIHDELGQQLTAIKMDVVWIDKKIPAEQETIKEKLKNIVQLLDGSNLSVRKILKELRVDLLDSYGIVEALEWQARQFTTSTGIPVNLSNNSVDSVLPAPVTNCLYRVFQEALTNITKYANATTVNCRLEYSKTAISLFVEDNGKGFDKETVKSKQSFGLLGIQERVSSLNGSFELHSEPGKGTTLLINLPLTGN
ncbi:MAG: PAS domain S-box protein [Flavihumibacter sp.]|nr:PAS domain S-box protein [Flavihumibacter sp.]